MATKTGLKPRSYAGRGAVDKFAIRVVGLVGSDAAGQMDSFENPFGVDVLILEAYVAITTIAANDANMDVGLADDVDGTSKGSEICASIIDTGVAIHAYKLHTPAVTGVAFPIWKAANSTNNAADSWISCWQNGSSDSSALRYNLILVVAKESDFNNDV